jgi:hypothetical protein
VNLLAKRPCPEGSSLSVDLPASGDQPATSILVRVVSAAEELDGRWSLGCAVARELSDADLQPFGAKPLQSAAPDRRKWVRFPCHARATYQKIPPRDSIHRTAEIVDIAPAGISLLTPDSLELGTVIQLECRNEHGILTLRTMCAVVRQTLCEDGGWEIGCQFVHEFSVAGVQSFLDAHGCPSDFTS